MRFSIDSYVPPQGGTSVALGYFDGVHLGHVSVLRAAASAAREGMSALAFTFSRQPRSVLRGSQLLATEKHDLNLGTLLTPMWEKSALIETWGLDCVYAEFTEELASWEAEDFVKVFLLNRLKARVVSVGPNYRFGYRARGDVPLLRRLGAELGFSVVEKPYVRLGNVTVSSTAVREALCRGEVDWAALALGRYFAVSGPVVHGKKLGRTIGVPTANVAVAQEQCLPARGTYAVWAELGGVFWAALANIGTCPTVSGCDAKRMTLEVNISHLTRGGTSLKQGSTTLWNCCPPQLLSGVEGLNTPGNELYGRSIRVHFVARLREEKTFASLSALKAQIELDRSEALKVLLGR